MALQISRLDKTLHVRATFDCGDPDLNDYLKVYAWQNQQKHQVGTTYVAVDDSQPQVVIGYYTLAMSEITSKPLMGSTLDKLPYLAIPAILLARLAVDVRFKGCGLGGKLLADALNRALVIGNQVGCRCLIVDAYPAAVGWYNRFGLIEIEGGRPGARHKKMFIDLRTVAKAKRA